MIQFLPENQIEATRQTGGEMLRDDRMVVVVFRNHYEEVHVTVKELKLKLRWDYVMGKFLLLMETNDDVMSHCCG